MRLARTISGWGVVIGTVCLVLGRRRAAIRCYRITGLGGVGAVYGHYAATRQIAVEPVPILSALLRDDTRREPLKAAAWHGAFWLVAEWLDLISRNSNRGKESNDQQTGGGFGRHPIGPI